MKDGKNTFDVEETLRLLTEAERMIESSLTEDERQAVASRIRRWEPIGAERQAIYASSSVPRIVWSSKVVGIGFPRARPPRPADPPGSTRTSPP